MRSFLSLALAALLFAAPVHAAEKKADTHKVEEYANSLGDRALDIITNKTLAKPVKQLQLEGLFADSVDIPWVGRFVMGRFWREASDAQKAQYLAEYQKFLVTQYAGRFAEYSGGDFKVVSTRDDGNGEYLVSMELLTDDKTAEPVLVDYRVREEKGKFKVFDIIVEGVSMITTQRSEFASVLSNKGIDYLIQQLASKTASVPPGSAAVAKKS